MIPVSHPTVLFLTFFFRHVRPNPHVHPQKYAYAVVDKSRRPGRRRRRRRRRTRTKIWLGGWVGGIVYFFCGGTGIPNWTVRSQNQNENQNAILHHPQSSIPRICVNLLLLLLLLLSIPSSQLDANFFLCIVFFFVWLCIDTNTHAARLTRFLLLFLFLLLSLLCHVFIRVFPSVTFSLSCSPNNTTTYLRYTFSLFHPQNKDVGQKLIGATGLMFTVPLLVFFLVRHWAKTIYDVPASSVDTYAGGAAILTTNLIIGVYCYMAYREDEEDKQLEGMKEGGGAVPPRVGQFKERTD
jgi:hypothetical protein